MYRERGLGYHMNFTKNSLNVLKIESNLPINKQIHCDVRKPKNRLGLAGAPFNPQPKSTSQTYAMSLW